MGMDCIEIINLELCMLDIGKKIKNKGKALAFILKNKLKNNKWGYGKTISLFLNQMKNFIIKLILHQNKRLNLNRKNLCKKIMILHHKDMNLKNLKDLKIARWKS